MSGAAEVSALPVLIPVLSDPEQDALGLVGIHLGLEINSAHWFSIERTLRNA